MIPERARDGREARGGAHPAIVRASRRAWRRVGLAALLVLGPMAVWIAVTSNHGPVPQARPLQHVEVDGPALALHWTGQECEQVDGERTEVTETHDEVLVVLWVDARPDGCTDDEVDRVHRIWLQEPLGDRDLIDGACLRPENHQHPRCEVEGTDGERAPCRFCVFDPGEPRGDVASLAP